MASEGKASPPDSDRDAREVFLEQARDHAPYLAVEADGARFLVATRDRHMGRHLFLKQTRPEFRVLGRAVTLIETLMGDDAIAGRLFVDVGANIGTSTVSALVSHRFGSAVACEPEEENYRLLRANVALNDLEGRVTALRVGVSDRVGHSNLVVTGGPAGKSRVVLDRRRIVDKMTSRAVRRLDDPDEGPEMTVTDLELVTLDELSRSGVVDRERLGMVWIDAEGHEGHILHGAGTVADAGVPIVFEFHPAGLEAEGTRGMVQEVTEQCYTHFVDVRRQEPDRRRFGLRPVTELPRFADRFLDRSSTASYTDLLLLRLDPAQASRGNNLPDLFAQQRGQHAADAGSPRAPWSDSLPTSTERERRLVESKALAYELFQTTQEVLEGIKAAQDQLVDYGRPVAFVHVPNAAGAAVTSVLGDGYRAKAAVLAAGNYMKDPEGTMAKISGPRVGRARVVVGHIPYGLFREHLPAGTRYVTLLREPIDRVLSHYYRHIHRTGTALDGRRPVTTDSIEEALEMRLFQITNLATRFLCADPSPSGGLPASALDEAKANLEEFALVGIEERLEESIVLLQRTLGLDLIPYEDSPRDFHFERPAVDEISEEQRDLIAEANQLDLELYSFAQELFDDAVAASGPEFAADVETQRGLTAAVTEDALQTAREWLDSELPAGCTKPFTELRGAAKAAGISVIALRRGPQLFGASRARNEDGKWLWTRTHEAH
jgi:FkbM family methyltransferase